MFLYLLQLVLMVAFVVHIVKTGRSTMWIWIVIMLPFAGALAYLIVELLPEMMNSRSGRTAARKVDATINPHRTLKQATQQYTLSDTVENTLQLANELLAKQRYAEAKPLYEKCLKGMYANDPDMLCSLARTEYALGDYAAVNALLDRLKQHNPDYRNADAHLLYAMALAGQGRQDEALHEYEALQRYYPGPEASCRYAQLLQAMGRETEARAVFADVVARAQHAGRHYMALHKTWVDMARKAAGK